ncbi:MAG: TonB-dependent receptor plug domain-containing protein [Sulfurimonas sp.]|nr:TonB-dependent receptor plug domain-containing protein [Sulfurimonas sp.]
MKKIVLGMSLVASALLADSIVEISPISVTATGMDEKVIEQALSMATKNEKEIQLDQVIFQKDLLNSLSGVRVEQTGSVIGHMTSIRMPISTNPYYLFMQDGIPVQSSGFFNHNGLAYTTFQSATSVEVLKGARNCSLWLRRCCCSYKCQVCRKTIKNKRNLCKRDAW